MTPTAGTREGRRSADPEKTAELRRRPAGVGRRPMAHPASLSRGDIRIGPEVGTPASLRLARANDLWT